ncbi:hypothetical protein ACT4MK_45890 [Bradyrhizobium barranii]|uniref:hypothetical protein n=1 Tax=Bradyrhizobium TaxID=374 RepID=UPI003F292439
MLIATSKLLGGPIARPDGQIKGISSYGIDIGQRLEVETPQGSGNVVDGEAGVISIENLTVTPVTCGVSELVNGNANPFALPHSMASS